MTRIRAILSIASLAFFALVLASRPAFADAHTEAVARDALQKAATDYASINYAGAVTRLKQAVHACGAKNCVPLTKATLLRDLGTMEFRAGDKTAAAKAFADALTIEPTLMLAPDYDAADVGAAWEDARAAAGLPAGPISSKPPPGTAAAPGALAGPIGAAPVPPARAGATTPAAGAGAHPAAPAPPPERLGEQPIGDFVHDPAVEQKEDTPLPILVEYSGTSKLAHVVVKYKGAQQREWTRVELKRVEGGATPAWEGAIPCADVARGTMRYWVQGFDRAGEPIAATGDPKHPYHVAIRDKITGEPPHLPGKEAPRSCEESDCPPGLPGCKGGKGGKGGSEPAAGGEASGSAGAGEGAAATEGEGAEKPPSRHSKLWIGVTGALDFLSLSTVTDVCRRTGDNNPVNSAGYSCYDPATSLDFPANAAVNQNLATGRAGTTSGGIQLGDVRVMVAVDYALGQNFLAGARLGYVFNAYPGKRASHFAPVHIEARGTYLFGHERLARSGLAPMVFVGLGLSEFDGHQATLVNYITNMSQAVDVWATDAPFFITVGGGVRYQIATRAALTGAIRLNIVIGNVVLPTYGPELGVLYGF